MVSDVSEFNVNGFKDVELPAGLNKLGDKRLKISLYCPAANQKSKSESKEIFANVVISAKTGENWQNISLTVDDLELLELRISKIKRHLLNVGGACNGKRTEEDREDL